MTIKKVYTLEQIDQWVSEGQAVSPKIAKELLYRIQELERKVSVCKNFIEWLTPCGQDGSENQPNHQIIGMEARDLIKHLSKE